MIARLISLFRNLRHHGRVDRDLDDEVRSYLDLLVEEKLRTGMTRTEAERAARLELGGVDAVTENVRDVRMGAWLEQTGRDVRFALRSFRRTPGFTLVALVTIALGVGGMTVAFSLIDAVLLQPLPYPNGDRIAMVLQRGAQGLGDAHVLSAPNFQDLEAGTRVFDRMALYEYRGFNLTGEGIPENVGGLRATSELFDVLGVHPMLGRPRSSPRTTPPAPTSWS